MRVVFTVLDALPVRHVGADHTPVLHELARCGGFAVGGARAVMTSATYPNHATFSTGTEPRDHGVVTNWVPEPGRVVPVVEVATARPDAVRRVPGRRALERGGPRRSASRRASWAPRRPTGTGHPTESRRAERGSTRWATSTTATLSSKSFDALDAAPDLLVSHLNGPDTAAHLFGPDSEGAWAGYRDTDAQLAVMREHIAWDDTVWILVSDHDQENVSVREPVDLQAEIERRGLTLFALPEGSASLVCGEGANTARAWLPEIDGVGGTAAFDLAANGLECCLVWSEPGRAFGFAGAETRLGTHGGPRTRAQVAVVTGGHTTVEPLARALNETPIEAADWAPTIAALLRVELPTATGRVLDR